MMVCLSACGEDDASATKPAADMAQADMSSPDQPAADMTDAPDQDAPDQDVPDQGAPDMAPDQGDLDMDALDMAPDQGDLDMDAPDMAPADMGGQPTLYVGTGDVYRPGPLAVRRRAVAARMSGAPAAMEVWAPEQPGGYPLVIFQHGFLLANVTYYDALLSHVASHGFVVVAPRMYAADGNPIGKPSTTEEAMLAADVRRWAAQQAGAVVGYTIRPELLALVGHSRGGKVNARQLVAEPTAADAVIGIDPVDGTGGPLGGDTRVISGAFTYQAPTLIIGTGLGPEALGLFAPACAPAGDNHVQFYNAAPAPAWHATVTDYGHLDMLNDNTQGCGIPCSSCKAGESRAPMRLTTAGLMVAFLRAELQGDTSASALLTQPRNAPASFTHEAK
jgi:chlorophyllase